jgi:hypothetical protein
MYLIFLIHLSVDRHLICFHFLAIVSSSEMNIWEQMSLQHNDFISSDYIPNSGIEGSYVSYIFNFFQKPSYCFPIMAILIYISTNSVQGIIFLPWVVIALLSINIWTKCVELFLGSLLQSIFCLSFPVKYLDSTYFVLFWKEQ